MNLWISLLRTTGGAIVVEPGKTDWVNIAFKDKKENLRLKPPQEDRETVHIEQLHVNTARKR